MHSLLSIIQQKYPNMSHIRSKEDVIQWFRSDPWKEDLDSFLALCHTAEFLFFRHVEMETSTWTTPKIYQLSSFKDAKECHAFAECVYFYEHAVHIMVDSGTVLDDAWFEKYTYLLKPAMITWIIPDDVVTHSQSNDLWKYAHKYSSWRQWLLSREIPVPYKEARDAILLWQEPWFTFSKASNKERMFVKLLEKETDMGPIAAFLKKYTDTETRENWLSRYLDKWLTISATPSPDYSWLWILDGNAKWEVAVWFMHKYGYTEPGHTPPIFDASAFFCTDIIQELEDLAQNGLINESYCGVFDYRMYHIQHVESTVLTFLEAHRSIWSKDVILDEMDIHL